MSLPSVSDISSAIDVLRSRGPEPAPGEPDLDRIEEVAAFVALYEGVPSVEDFERLDAELRDQASRGAPESRALLQDLAAGWRELASSDRALSEWRSWPEALRPFVFERVHRVPDLLVVAEQIAEDGTTVDVERLIEHAASISPGKSRSLTRLLEVIGELPHPAARATAEGLRRRTAYRGVPPADLSASVFERVEDWAFELEQAFGDVTNIPPRRAGLFVKMATDLCDLRTVADWREASDGLTAANFHGLAALFLARAERLEARLAERGERDLD